MALPVFDKNSTLAEIFAHLVAELKRGKHDKHHPFKSFVLSTVSVSQEPQSRYVVLRDVLDTPLELVFFTDERSAKVAEIYHQPTCHVVFYHPAKKLQLRMHCQASIHLKSDLTDGYFRQLQGNHKDYTTRQAPGSPIDHAAADYEEALRNNFFSVVCLRVISIDALQLSREGHLRASFSLLENGTLANSQWLVP